MGSQFTRDLGIPYSFNECVLNSNKYKAQHVHWHATCFILKYRWIITIIITLFTEGEHVTVKN